ncbi:hypothetical protein POM88_012452 [Heracleum sosnowskyi]|uniref:Small auxin up regulated protein n=1 Tax=Heracleum sosnowskyi TaxID=360622 RepID=A0AAD8IXF9_9APIA|nr:hypothetical protein POM88_012452 [Heracleum sosnowskyi]
MKKILNSPPTSPYRRLNDQDKDNRVRKGRIPVLVGLDMECMERVSVPAKVMKHPYVIGLLEIAAHEFGYVQQGTLRIWCEVSSFKRMIDLISKGKYRLEISSYLRLW